MNVVVIEDEPLVREHLISLLQRTDQTIQVVGSCDTVQSSVAWFAANAAPDIAFMDIRLADGLSFEIFNQCTVPCPVIFTTAYDQYAIQAFTVNSIDYLLKPIKQEALLAALEKFKRLQSGTSAFVNKEVIGGLVADVRTGHKSRFVIKVGEHLRMIPTEKVAYFYSQDKATWLRTSEGKEYPLEQSIDAVAESVDPRRFFRINRKFLIAIDAIEDIVVYSGSRLQVKLSGCVDDSSIVSRERVSEFRLWIEG